MLFLELRHWSVAPGLTSFHVIAAHKKGFTYAEDPLE